VTRASLNFLKTDPHASFRYSSCGTSRCHLSNSWTFVVRESSVSQWCVRERSRGGPSLEQ